MPADRKALSALLALALAAVPGVGQPDSPDADVVVRETVDVILHTVEVRVLDRAGSPVRDLSNENFEVQLGKLTVPVQAVDWIGEQRFTQDEYRDLARSGVTVPPSERLIVFFVQTDLQSVRARGMMQLLPRARELLDSFRPDDHLAVVSFDSHLKLRQDFTSDRERVLDALRASLRTGTPPEIERTRRYPSLTRAWDPGKALRAATPERALELVAESLVPFPGDKMVIFTGWGLGRYGAFGVHMREDYFDARRALERANATVFVLDITQADYHDLEVGLQKVADDTGGTYTRTYEQPGKAAHRLAETLTGHYEVSFVVPPEVTRFRRVKIKLRETKGELFMSPVEVMHPRGLPDDEGASTEGALFR